MTTADRSRAGGRPREDLSSHDFGFDARSHNVRRGAVTRPSSSIARSGINSGDRELAGLPQRRDVVPRRFLQRGAERRPCRHHAPAPLK